MCLNKQIYVLKRLRSLQEFYQTVITVTKRLISFIHKFIAFYFDTYWMNFVNDILVNCNLKWNDLINENVCPMATTFPPTTKAMMAHYKVNKK